MSRTGVARKPLVLVVSTSVILLLLSGCVLEPDYRGAVGLGPRVSVLGDSLFDASATAIHESLDATHRVRIGAVETRTIANF